MNLHAHEVAMTSHTDGADDEPIIAKNTNKKTKAGRPRSEESTKAILEATRRLLTHMPVSKLSIEAIAKKAGVGKTTIYRWWPNKQAVLMDAVFSQGNFNNFLPQTGEPMEIIHAQIDKMLRQLSGKNGRIVAEIIGEVQGDPEALKSLIDTFFQDRYNALGSAVSSGIQSGTFRSDIDIECAIDLILGPIIFRLMSGQEFDAAFEKQITTMLFHALKA